MQSALLVRLQSPISPSNEILKTLYNEMTYADVVLTPKSSSNNISNSVRPIAHKSILAQISPFLKNILELNPDSHEIILPDFECHVILKILELVYTGECVCFNQSEICEIVECLEALKIFLLSSFDVVTVTNNNINNTNTIATSKELHVKNCNQLIDNSSFDNCNYVDYTQNQVGGLDDFSTRFENDGKRPYAEYSVFEKSSKLVKEENTVCSMKDRKQVSKIKSHEIPKRRESKQKKCINYNNSHDTEVRKVECHSGEKCENKTVSLFNPNYSVDYETPLNLEEGEFSLVVSSKINEGEISQKILKRKRKCSPQNEFFRKKKNSKIVVEVKDCVQTKKPQQSVIVIEEPIVTIPISNSENKVDKKSSVIIFEDERTVIRPIIRDSFIPTNILDCSSSQSQEYTRKAALSDHAYAFINFKK